MLSPLTLSRAAVRSALTELVGRPVCPRGLYAVWDPLRLNTRRGFVLPGRRGLLVELVARRCRRRHGSDWSGRYLASLSGAISDGVSP